MNSVEKYCMFFFLIKSYLFFIKHNNNGVFGHYLNDKRTFLNMHFKQVYPSYNNSTFYSAEDVRFIAALHYYNNRTNRKKGHSVITHLVKYINTILSHIAEQLFGKRALSTCSIRHFSKDKVKSLFQVVGHQFLIHANPTKIRHSMNSYM